MREDDLGTVTKLENLILHAPAASKHGRGRPRNSDQARELHPPPAASKRGRGRPHKSDQDPYFSHMQVAHISQIYGVSYGGATWQTT